MTGSMENRDDFLAAIEQLGEDTVRARIKAQHWSAKQRVWANQWLKELESRRRAEEQASAAEARELSRSVAGATREAADATRIQAVEASEANRIAREASEKAHTANTIAIVAVIISIVTVAVMVITAFVR